MALAMRAQSRKASAPPASTSRQPGQFAWKPAIFSEIPWYPANTRCGPQISAAGVIAVASNRMRSASSRSAKAR